MSTPSSTTYPSGQYEGRLVCDGLGNLLADEGEHAGYPVAFHEGVYVFVQPGELSHNERHHLRFADVRGTTDEDAAENPHHFETQPDDPHYDEDAPNKTRLRFHPDAVAAKISGHTEAYRG